MTEIREEKKYLVKFFLRDVMKQELFQSEIIRKKEKFSQMNIFQYETLTKPAGECLVNVWLEQACSSFIEKFDSSKSGNT